MTSMRMCFECEHRDIRTDAGEDLICYCKADGEKHNPVRPGILNECGNYELDRRWVMDTFVSAVQHFKKAQQEYDMTREQFYRLGYVLCDQCEYVQISTCRGDIHDLANVLGISTKIVDRGRTVYPTQEEFTYNDVKILQLKEREKDATDL